MTGLRFSRQLADRLEPAAADHGVHLEASFWPEEDHGELDVMPADRQGPPPNGAPGTTARG